MYNQRPTIQEWLGSGSYLVDVAEKPGDRAWVKSIRHQGRGVVIKPPQSSQEAAIALKADSLGVGPTQLETTPDLITEELVPGTFFADLPQERRTERGLQEIGQSLGLVFGRLHRNGICYNDCSLLNDYGNTHVVVGEDNQCRLIDFGISVDLTNYPDIDSDSAWALFRIVVEPQSQVMFSPPSSELARKKFMDEHLRLLRRYPAPLHEILERDHVQVDFGLRCASRKWGTDVRTPFLHGYRLGYETATC